MAKGASLDCRKAFMRNNGIIRKDVPRVSINPLKN